MNTPDLIDTISPDRRRFLGKAAVAIAAGRWA